MPSVHHYIIATDLLKRGTGQVRLQHDEAVLLFREVPHVSVRLPVVQGDGGEVVERGVEVVGHVSW